MKKIPAFYKWEMLVWLWLAFFLNQADRAIFGVVLPDIKTKLHLTDTQEGLIASALFWTLAIMVPVAGYVGDLLSRKKIIGFSLLFWSIATTFTGMAKSWIHLVIFRSVATGGGEAFYAPSANALISQFHHKTRSLALSIHQTSLYVGVIGSGFLGGWIADRWGWYSAFYVFGSLGVVLAVVILLRLHDAPSDGRSAVDATSSTTAVKPRVLPWEAVSALFRTPTALLLTIAFTADVFVNNGYMTWSPTFLHEKFDLSLAEAGGFSMLYHHVFAFVGVVLGGILSDLWAVRRRRIRLELQFVGLLLGAPFIYMMGVGETQLAIYVGMAGFGLFRGLYEANIYASLYDVIPERLRGSASGIMIMFAFWVGGVAPLLLGMMKTHYGLAMGLSRLSLVFVVGAAALLLALQVFFKRDYCTADFEGR